MFCYKEIIEGDGTPAYKFGESDTPPTGYATLTTVEQFRLSWRMWDLSTYYLIWRIAFKYLVVQTMGGGNEETGFNAIPTAEDKYFAASHNIGTGDQRRLAIPNDQERDLACYNYILYNEGVVKSYTGSPSGKQNGGVWAKAVCFSRCDHIAVPELGGLSLPNWVFAQLNITAQNASELSGNLLEMYKQQGIKGISLSDAPPLGISDYCTETLNTRYSQVNGGGMKTNTVYVGAVTANSVGISGFGNNQAAIDAFADFMLQIVKFGNAPYNVI